jgi:predicted RNase H-like nuclease
VVSGRLVGTTLFPEEPRVLKRLQEVVDHIPGFTVVALAAPVGLPDKPTKGGRSCDREARRLIGWPRSGAVRSAPCRAALRARTYEDAKRLNGGRLDVVTWRSMARIREVAAEIQSHLQRSVYEVQPELSFLQLNKDRPLRFGKSTKDGQEERMELLSDRMRGLTLDASDIRGASTRHVLDASISLWTARRIYAKAATRIPESQEWNDEGLRLEIVR